MDPNACWLRILDAADNAEQFHALLALFGWLKKGGFAPTIRGKHFISVSVNADGEPDQNGTAEAFSILWDVEKQRHEFRRYANDKVTHRFPL